MIRTPPYRAVTWQVGCRYLNTANTAPKPHAYLRPLAPSSIAESNDFAGAMCLTMDRQEARNALSVQMVQVCTDLARRDYGD